MKYKVGDKVYFKNSIFEMKAEILEVYEKDEDFRFDYYIRYTDYKGYQDEVLVRESDITGFVEGTKEYLKQEIDKLLDMYTKEDILNLVK